MILLFQTPKPELNRPLSLHFIETLFHTTKMLSIMLIMLTLTISETLSAPPPPIAFPGQPLFDDDGHLIVNRSSMQQQRISENIESCLNIVSYTDYFYYPGWRAMVDSVCLTSSYTVPCVNQFVIVPQEDCRKLREAYRDNDLSHYIRDMYTVGHVPDSPCFQRPVKVIHSCFDPKRHFPDTLWNGDHQILFGDDSGSKRSYLDAYALNNMPTGLVMSRMFSASLFPYLNLVIMIDADTVVRTDLGLLLAEYSDLKEKDERRDGRERALGAVFMKQRNFKKAFRMKNLPVMFDNGNYAPLARCFQNGVMVTDLSWWRKNDVETMFLDLTKVNAHYDLYDLHDMDAMNLIFYDHSVALGDHWNVYGLGNGPLDEQGNELVRDVLRDASILHWSGPCKPWTVIHKHPDHVKPPIEGEERDNSELVHFEEKMCNHRYWTLPVWDTCPLYVA